MEHCDSGTARLETAFVVAAVAAAGRNRDYRNWTIDRTSLSTPIAGRDTDLGFRVLLFGGSRYDGARIYI
uniref:Uncharacterized protein n=1 Tax=Cucumis sativus TaxID=3659 RepID=A0A0A0L6R2_CUCSA